MMSVNSYDINKLKKEFNELTNTIAEEKPVDFAAFLHLKQLQKMDQLLFFNEASNTQRSTSWADVKNFMDEFKGNQ